VGQLDLVNKSTYDTTLYLDKITAAVNAQIQDYAQILGRGTWDLVDKVNASGWKIYLFDNSDQANALGYHSVTPTGASYARVFVKPVLDNGGSWLNGSLSVSAVVSHEAIELLGDPGINIWIDDLNGKLWARELCDAVESDSYVIQGVSVSNFLYPSYFNAFGKAPFDRLGTLSAPFTLAKGGYAVQMSSAGAKQVFGEEYPEWRKATKTEGSRTWTRVAVEPPLG